MRIQRFEAKDTHTALTLVKRALGDEAVILATRSLPPDKVGGRPRIEVVAARDYDLEGESDKGQPPPVAGYGYQTVRRKAASAPSPAVGSAPSAPPPGESLPRLESHDLRRRFSELMRQAAEKAPGRFRRFSSGEVARSSTKAKARPSELEEVRRWRDQVVDTIQLEQPEAGQEAGGGPAYIALVGATGVGKTTTAAKLAAWHALRRGRKVALLSMDCYRIGATDQLRTYAQIMRLPCEIVLRRQDLACALERHLDKEMIVIDTAGRSPYDGRHIQELGEWFAPHPEIKPHLVLSATAKKEDLQATLESYVRLAARNLILTKLDETRAYAALCQQVAASGLGVAYLATGQRVPEDFLAATKEGLETLFKQGWTAAVKTWEPDRRRPEEEGR